MSETSMVERPPLVAFWRGQKIEQMEKPALIEAVYELALMLEASRAATLDARLVFARNYFGGGRQP